MRPTGTVTFLFTDVEGSTERWERLPEAMRVALRRHDEILRTEIERCGGRVFKTVGDAFCAAFASAENAAQAAIGAQQMLTAADWSAVDGVRVRMALHTGVTDERADDYFGPPVNRVARLLSIAHGGQVLISSATFALVREQLPPGCAVCDLGEHVLKNIALPEHVYGLVGPGTLQTFPPLRSVDARPNNLSQPLTTFIDQEDSLRRIQGLIEAYPLVTLIGAGGIGKSRQALEVGHRILEHFSDGVWFVELAPIADGSRVASVVGNVLNVREQIGTPMLELLPSALATKRLLLILDNCEHVVAAVADLVARLLKAAPEVRILATSREALRVAGETAHNVAALAAPDSRMDGVPSIEQLRDSPAVRLFLDRAGSANPQFAVRLEDAPSLLSVCRRLDGIPLAIELAAARMSALSVRQLAVRLDDRFRLLTKGLRTALPRQQTLRALVDWSFDLLAQRERQLFAALSVFAGRFSLEAATWVCAISDEDEWGLLDLITSLTDKSLLMRETDADAFYLLETTRYYAAEKLREGGMQTDYARRHFRYFLQFATDAQAQFEITSGPEWLARMRAALDNLRAALSWSIEQKQDVTAGIALTSLLCEAWMGLGLDRECTERIDTALSCCDAETPTVLRARLTLARAQLAVRSQRGAIEPAREAVALYESTNDERGLASAFNTLGYALAREDRLAEADANFSASLAIATRIENVRQRGLALLNLGVNRETANEFDQARALYDAALALGIARGDEYLVGAANLDHSVLCEAVDDPQTGFAYARNAYDAYRRAGDTNGAALALGNMTTNLIGIGRMDEARAAARDYVVHARAHRQDTTFVVALEKIAAIAQSTGDCVTSAKLLGFTAARSAALGLRRDPGNLRFTDGLRKHLHEQLGADVSRLLDAGAALSEAAVTELALIVASG